MMRVSPHGDEAAVGVVAFDAADGQERTEGVEEILSEMAAGDRLADPSHRSPVVEGVRARGLEIVLAGDLTDLNGTLDLQG